MKAPVAVFTYNRLEHTRRMLDSLAGCYRLDECQLYIFSDGPKSPDQIQAVQAVRELIRAWGDEHDAIIEERNENLGLAHSIVDNVTRLCDQFGRVIVVEDDLVLHPAFLHYMLSALDRYENELQVAQVSGHMYSVDYAPQTDAIFLPVANTWGWGTWKRAWQLFEWNPEDAAQAMQNSGTRSRFSLDNSSIHSEILSNRLQGKNQSWGVLFYWAMFRNRKLVLYPALSLVFNTGFDGGTHHRAKSRSRNQSLLDADKWPPGHVFTWPDAVQTDAVAYGHVQAFLREFFHPLKRNLYQRLWHRLQMVRRRS